MARSIPRLMSAVVCVALAMLDSSAAAVATEGRLRGVAYAGDPFGVGFLEADLPSELEPPALGWAGLSLSEKASRVLYPAVDAQSLGGTIKDVLGQSRRPAARLLGGLIDRTGKAKIYFLFLGRQPLELALDSQTRQPVTLVPMENEPSRQQLLQAWWRQYTAQRGLLQKKPDYPPMLENYLRAMLARRLGLKLPEAAGGESWQEEVARDLNLVAGAESLRMNVERDRFLTLPATTETADQPLPRPVENLEPAMPEPAGNIEVEPLAMRVPAECLYVRFGGFTNFLWFQDTLARIGGEFQNLVATRGLDRGTRERLETQLATQNTALARLLGDTIIADVAIVGTDLFLQEGGSYGLLFQAKSSMILGTSLTQQRQVWKQKIPGTTETHVKIADRDVDFLSSPDGRVRSYYAVDGDFHFVTTSKALVARFFQTRSGNGSLGASREFRYARSAMPIARKDLVFVYVSSAFFQNLLGPAYRVEMMRRLEALGDLELAEMALLASKAEGKPSGSIDELVAGGFLPPGFGVRPDGSRTVLEKGVVRDSLRGKRGWFAPISDVDVRGLTPSEATAYQHATEFYQGRWGQLDPVVAGIQRQAIERDRDRVIVDLRFTPAAKQHLETLGRFVGVADKQRIRPAQEDAIMLDVILPRQRIFAGLQKVGGGAEGGEGRVFSLNRLRNLLVGYVGSTDQVGVLNADVKASEDFSATGPWDIGMTVVKQLQTWIPFRPLGPPDAQGFSRGEAGLWQRRMDHFTVFSFQRDVLERVTSRLGLEETPRPSQLRLHVSDLSNSALVSFVNGWGYARTRETSLGNLRLMHQMTEQLHLPADTAKAAAEAMLDAKLVCPLDGQYVFRTTPDGAGYWTSTAIEGTRRPGLLHPQSPEGYLAPPLNWFRGMELDAAIADGAVSAHVELDMQWPSAKQNDGAKTGND